METVQLQNWFHFLDFDTSVKWHVVFICVSLVGVLSYYIGYVIAYRSQIKHTFSIAGYFCFFGASASISWLILPFFPQPRFGIFSGGDVSIIGIATQIYGILLFIWFANFTFRAKKSNLSATYDRFFAPKHLITDGKYGIIRHPMLIGDCLAHAGLSLATGSIYTSICFPIYYIIAEIFIEIQERYVLFPHFKADYRSYSKSVPRSWSKNNILFPFIAIILFVASFWEIHNI